MNIENKSSRLLGGPFSRNFLKALHKAKSFHLNSVPPAELTERVRRQLHADASVADLIEITGWSIADATTFIQLLGGLGDMTGCHDYVLERMEEEKFAG